MQSAEDRKVTEPTPGQSSNADLSRELSSDYYDPSSTSVNQQPFGAKTQAAIEAAPREKVDPKAQDSMLLELQEEVKRLRGLVDRSPGTSTSSRKPAVPGLAEAPPRPLTPGQVTSIRRPGTSPGSKSPALSDNSGNSPRGHHGHTYIPEAMRDQVPGIRERRPSPGVTNVDTPLTLRERRLSPSATRPTSPPVPEELADADAEAPDPENPKDPDDGALLGWEWRGNAMGLILDDGLSAAWYAFLLLVILFGVWGEPRWQTPCPMVVEMGHNSTQVKVTPSVALCEYTKAYILCFPEMALSVLTLLVGRNLLQKRFYYGVLQRGGVMNYMALHPLKDPFIWALIWCYGHVLLFLGLVFFKAIEPPDFASEGKYTQQLKDSQAKLGEDKTGAYLDAATLALILNLAGFIVLPGTICVLFIYVSYNIEQTLVPLSRFVHCAQDHALAIGAKISNQFNDIVLLQDHHLKYLVDTQRSHMQEAFHRGGLHALYQETVRRYKADEALRMRHPERKDPSKVILINSLWPGKLILHKGAAPNSASTPRSMLKAELADPDGAVGFLWLWRSYLATAVTISLLLLAFLGERLWFSVVLTTWNGTIGWQDTGRLLVELAHLIAVLCVLFRVAQVTFIFMDRVPDPVAMLEESQSKYKAMTAEPEDIVKPHPWGVRRSRRPW